jgi:alkylation response protein AidB-like acyl-CoA dehydrogenase
VDFGLTDDQREIQRTARELLSARATPDRVREHAEARRPDRALWDELRELGWLGIALPERYGGQGLGRVELSVLCEELGRSLAPVPFLPTVLASTLIEHAGSDEQRERLLPALASGEQGGAVGVIGAGAGGAVVGDGRAGSEVGGGQSESAIVGGRAELVIGGGEAHVFVLLGGDSDSDAGDRPRARVLSARDAEVTLVPSIDPTRSAADVAFSAQAGEPLQGDVAGGLDRALTAVAAELVGVCDRALAMTVAYVKERKQFGVPVGSYQAVSHRCAQMLLDAERARVATAYASWAADADPELLPRAAAMAKASASEAAVEVCASAIQAHGGIGFTWEADVHWLYKRALLNAALLGAAKRQRARLAALL